MLFNRNTIRFCGTGKIASRMRSPGSPSCERSWCAMVMPTEFLRTSSNKMGTSPETEDEKDAPPSLRGAQGRFGGCRIHHLSIETIAALNKIVRTCRSLRHVIGREPTAEEIAGRLRLPPETNERPSPACAAPTYPSRPVATQVHYQARFHRSTQRQSTPISLQIRRLKNGVRPCKFDACSTRRIIDSILLIRRPPYQRPRRWCDETTVSAISARGLFRS
jgi:sigma-70-like protein